MDPNRHAKTIYYHKAINSGQTRFLISANTYCKVIALGITGTQMFFSKKKALLGKHLIKVK